MTTGTSGTMRCWGDWRVYGHRRTKIHSMTLISISGIISCFARKTLLTTPPYFITFYRSVRKKSSLFEKRFVHPEDWLFQLMNIQDDSASEIERKMIREKMYIRIMALIRRKFPTDYRLFCLKVVTPGCSYRELQLYTGISASVIRKKIITIKETIKNEIKYETYYLQQ